MMTSIFTTFDMVTSSHPSVSYAYGLIPAIMFNQLYWIYAPNRFYFMSFISSNTSDLNNSTNTNYLKGSALILYSTFILLIIMNLFGALPYTVTLTSHLMMTISLGAPLWLSLLLISMTSNYKLTAIHFLPKNTPSFIANFLVLVETLSSIIRPLTLSFRLAANISAGHVILGMMSSGLIMVLFVPGSFLALFLMMTGYYIFELAICLVQAFVFLLLTFMYSNDYIHNHSLLMNTFYSKI